MTFDSRKRKFSREHIYVIEIDGDYCSLEFGVSPCTATGTGDAKCFNTLASCQDPENYATSVKTYRFCSMVSPHPVGLDAIPSLQSVSVSPAKIDIAGGLGVRSSVSLSFNDHPSSDIGIDKYVDGRTYIASERGSYWTKWRARNPFYQGLPVRVLSGYLNDDGSYSEANMQARHYVVETVNVSGGRCSITGKDPLKLADNNRAQAPKASTGTLAAALTNIATTATLEPSGVGDLEYPASGFVRIGAEVMAFTRSGDTLTLTRGQYNTAAVAHSADASVQLCLEYNDQLNDIVYDLLVNYADVDAGFIPTAEWQSEIDDFQSGLLQTLITEPVGVQALLKELGEQAPHSLYWDERTQKIKLTCVKPPPIDADVIDEDGNILADSLRIKDELNMRVNTVFVYFGQIDPTRKLDEVNNYAQTYVRVDTDTIEKYGSNKIKTIYSRWINNNNKAAALVLAAKIGRRFGFTPRSITFELDAKDSSVWAGQSVDILHHEITDFTGAAEQTTFQIVSVAERDTYSYEAIEYSYADALPEDEGGGDPGVDLIVIAGTRENLNIRSIYDGLFPAPDATTKVKFVVEDTAIIGSTTNSTAALVTGSWPSGALVTIENRGYIVGKGGDGDTYLGSGGEAGGDALELNYPVTLNNLGIIGGGGGGGGYGYESSIGEEALAEGAGGAGYVAGISGTAFYSGSGGSSTQLPGDPDIENGGAAGSAEGDVNAFGGAGGDLGAAGTAGSGGTSSSGGGAAGDAIVTNGNAITYTAAGDIRGAVI